MIHDYLCLLELFFHFNLFNFARHFLFKQLCKLEDLIQITKNFSRVLRFLLSFNYFYGKLYQVPIFFQQIIRFYLLLFSQYFYLLNLAQFLY